MLPFKKNKNILLIPIQIIIITILLWFISYHVITIWWSSNTSNKEDSSKQKSYFEYIPYTEKENYIQRLSEEAIRKKDNQDIAFFIETGETPLSEFLFKKYNLYEPFYKREISGRIYYHNKHDEVLVSYRDKSGGLVNAFDKKMDLAISDLIDTCEKLYSNQGYSQYLNKLNIEDCENQPLYRFGSLLPYLSIQDPYNPNKKHMFSIDGDDYFEYVPYIEKEKPEKNKLSSKDSFYYDSGKVEIKPEVIDILPDDFLKLLQESIDNVNQEILDGEKTIEKFKEEIEHGSIVY